MSKATRHLLCTAYVYVPPNELEQAWAPGLALAEAHGERFEVVLNPKSGPDPAQAAAYGRLLEALHVRGARALGYVWAHPQRTHRAVLADARQWFDLLPNLDGLFCDDARFRGDQIDRFLSLHATIDRSARSGGMTLNVGAAPSADWLGLLPGVRTVIFEGPAQRSHIGGYWCEGFLSWSPPSTVLEQWREGRGSKLSVLIHSASDPKIRAAVIQRLDRLNIPSAWVTDVVMRGPETNTWGTWPAQWSLLGEWADRSAGLT